MAEMRTGHCRADQTGRPVRHETRKAPDRQLGTITGDGAVYCSKVRSINGGKFAPCRRVVHRAKRPPTHVEQPRAESFEGNCYYQRTPETNDDRAGSSQKNGAAIGSRTPNLQIRSLALYPVELWPRSRGRKEANIPRVVQERICPEVKINLRAAWRRAARGRLPRALRSGSLRTRPRFAARARLSAGLRASR